MPLVEPFSAQILPQRINQTFDGKRRKQPLDLSQCQLMKMIQYNCDVENKYTPKAAVTCHEVLRVFRRCANGTTVETTAWEKEII
ncbi:hypothetical protein EJ05DRAFT_501184 [Pseudovirgaria hyperparasitica]|uniref:Mitochondrial export protein Som1 n=1 Tax=Pseudovirgaria hyperparasitica TaxID=470096 RepID=A0A6A6W7V0_9PEZI|nr:uncharacterized protein EJ05DRAFT_501184 [Pseudovirgaria hyperparasitica]KAF2757657.1 hypothetical protein EJ05DRAFT_501184 [Pseudovirgaria hyperparasitica]